jgi:GrpB-like predicted nucleotidyltransferase (UPF0157 family)
MLLEKYTTKWADNFVALRTELQTVIVNTNCTIEHVGSTAVPNLAAKPIIDIDIIYSNNEEFTQIKTELEKIGYYHNGNQGIEDRDVFKRNGLANHQILDTIKHHLYVCKNNSKALERHILLRNHLIKNENARNAYAQMKYKIAVEANQDRKVYATLKEMYTNDFIDAIIVIEKQNDNVMDNL